MIKAGRQTSEIPNGAKFWVCDEPDWWRRSRVGLEIRATARAWRLRVYFGRTMKIIRRARLQESPGSNPQHGSHLARSAIFRLKKKDLRQTSRFNSPETHTIL